MNEQTTSSAFFISGSSPFWCKYRSGTLLNVWTNTKVLLSKKTDLISYFTLVYWDFHYQTILGFQNIGLMLLFFSLYYQFCFDVPINALKMIVEQIFFSFANLPMLSPGFQQASIISVLLSNFGLQEGWFNCAKRYPVFGLILELNLVTFSNLKTWHCGCFNFYFCFLAIFFSEALKLVTESIFC